MCGAEVAGGREQGWSQGFALELLECVAAQLTPWCPPPAKQPAGGQAGSAPGHTSCSSGQSAVLPGLQGVGMWR